MNSTTFCVSNLTDTDLSNLLNSCATELQKRRAEWIQNYYWSFVGHPNSAIQVTGERTIVAIYSRHDGVRIGTAYPIKGDVYDHETGIAVAYAKALGDRIPGYI